MEKIIGYVEHIVFRNEDNGYTVFHLHNEDGDLTCVGMFHYISEGEFLEVSGEYTNHAVYGSQLQVQEYRVKEPEDLHSIEVYLGSGAIKGLGSALAGRIVRKFKGDTFRIIEEEPERLAEIKGISERMAREIAVQVEEKKEMRQAMLYLQKYGISTTLAAKIYQHYGQSIYRVIEQNPYQLADHVEGVGFKTADEIAAKVGIHTDSDFRIRSGIFYTLLQAVGEGHVYLPEQTLLARTSQLLQVKIEDMERHLMDLCMEKKIVVKEKPEGKRVYASHFYYLELNTAKMLYDLDIKNEVGEDYLEKRLSKIEAYAELSLDELQRTAVKEAVKNGLLVLTGGPGTGKTTTINAMIHFFESEGLNIYLAAPTGRAAKRMTETTGYEARTIHRMLELVPSGIPDSGSMAGNNASGKNTSFSSGGMHFDRNEENPLDADVIIIDEMSMVDISLMHSLLRAVNVGTRLILVGDVDQLPSVGPGNVLRDIIDSGCFNVVKLTHIFRQAAQSDIIVNAHKINEGERVDLAKRSRDFLFIRRENPDAVISAAITLIQQKLPDYVHAQPGDIQVMTPMRKGALGVERLNQILQNYLNPPDPSKKEKEAGGIIYRTGDKVMQIKNNYQMEWEIRSKYGIPTDKGAGVFNGDMGIIREINEYAENLTVEFDEGKMVEYSFKQLEELELAYAITIHKSQGSEYPAVIIPMYSGPRMLMTRNLIYTAVTRARSCVCLVGRPDAFYTMADNSMEQKRYCGLKARIEEIYA